MRGRTEKRRTEGCYDGIHEYVYANNATSKKRVQTGRGAQGGSDKCRSNTILNREGTRSRKAQMEDTTSTPQKDK